ncbi:distal tubule morphoproteinsis [Sparganum proliferum]
MPLPHCDVVTTTNMLSPHQETFYDKIPLKDVCPELSQLQKESKIVDLTLKTQDGLLLNVHRIIFAARLPKLKDNICSSATSTIDWSRFPQKSVRALTTYVYTGRLEVSTRTSQSIYLLAASVELEHVRRWCRQFIIQRLSTSNINQIWDFAVETGHQDLRLPCLDFMQKHFEAVVETRNFGTLSEDVLSYLISSDDLVVSREEQVVEAILTWAASACNQSNAGLAASLPRLLSSVRWEEVSASYLSELLSRDRPPSIDSSCTNFLQSIKSCKTTENDCPRQVNKHHRRRSRKYLLLVGERFSQADGQWSAQTLDPTSGFQDPLPDMNQRNASQLVALNGLAYVIGGEVGHGLSTSVVEFNPKTRRWRRVASSLIARCGHAAAGFGYGIVSCGGWKDETAIGFAELFLPARNRWLRLPNLLDARAAHRAVADEESGRIFVTGGENELGDQMDLVEYCTLPSCSPTEQTESHSLLTWHRAAPMNQKRKYHALAYVKGKIVAVGGYIGSWEFTQTVEVFTPPDHSNPSGQWTLVRPLSLGFDYPFAVALDDDLFVFPGGVSYRFQSTPLKASFSDLERSTDSEDQVWTDLGPMSAVREVNGVVALPSPSHPHTL